MSWDKKMNVLLIGGGMISQEVVIPALLQERLRGVVGDLHISALNSGIIKQCEELFPGGQFQGHPDPAKYAADDNQPALYQEAMAKLGEHGLVVVATPDHLHTNMILEAVEAGHDVIVMKPLCLKVDEAHRVIAAAEKGQVYVATDYHKRLDRAVRLARYRVRRGDLGEMLHGHAWIEEPKYMPLKFFGLWAEKSSPFEYIGVHYADAYYFITGLIPKRVAAWGQKKFLPSQGSDAYDAVQAVIEWNDGSVLWIQTSWVCSEKNSAMTNQGLQISGTKGEYWADHKFRNLHILTDDSGFEQINPNFFKHYDSWEIDGETEYVGYGFESISRWLRDSHRLHCETEGMSAAEARSHRQQTLKSWEAGQRPLPRQALIGVAVNEAVRLSLDNNNAYVAFDDQMYPKLSK
ncbi:MAG: Gfo/Idh/MocA family oxidoreductase [Proteobacteria bacterium]|nr:Gfo/Idh/MocA family oxidoreductase [Pseudomonadota bacterium]